MQHLFKASEHFLKSCDFFHSVAGTFAKSLDRGLCIKRIWKRSCTNIACKTWEKFKTTSDYKVLLNKENLWTQSSKSHFSMFKNCLLLYLWTKKNVVLKLWFWTTNILLSNKENLAFALCSNATFEKIYFWNLAFEQQRFGQKQKVLFNV